MVWTQIALERGSWLLFGVILMLHLPIGSSEPVFLSLTAFVVQWIAPIRQQLLSFTLRLPPVTLRPSISPSLSFSLSLYSELQMGRLSAEWTSGGAL